MEQTYKIAFFNRKGGTGKTTSVINVAGELADRGYSVLVVDTDPQGNASQNLGCYPENTASLPEVISGDADVNDVIIETMVDGIDILPTGLNLQTTETNMIINTSSRNDLYIFKVMRGIKKHYDFILVDCSPSFGIMTTNVLTYVDNVLIPIKTDRNSLEGYENLADKVKTIREDSNDSLKVLGVFLTVFEKSPQLDKVLYDASKEQLGDLFMETVIHKNISIREAPLDELPVKQYSKRSVGAKDYAKLTDEILERLGVQQ